MPLSVWWWRLEPAPWTLHRTLRGPQGLTRPSLRRRQPGKDSQGHTRPSQGQCASKIIFLYHFNTHIIDCNLVRTNHPYFIIEWLGGLRAGFFGPLSGSIFVEFSGKIFKIHWLILGTNPSFDHLFCQILPESWFLGLSLSFFPWLYEDFLPLVFLCRRPKKAVKGPASAWGRVQGTE